MPSELQLSVAAVGVGEALAVADGVAVGAVAAAAVEEDRTAEDARGLAAAAAVEDGAAFGFATAFGDRLACGLADAGATAALAVLVARIMADAAESTPTPPCVALPRLTGRLVSAESWATGGWPLAATRP
jgi:hypothetical protein